MKPALTAWILLLPGIASSLKAADAPASPATGPLRVHPDNPRYFMDPSGKIVYLTAAHTWANLQEIGVTDPAPARWFLRVAQRRFGGKIVQSAVQRERRFVPQEEDVPVI